MSAHHPFRPAFAVLLIVLALAPAARAAGVSDGRIGPATHTTANGRVLEPAGRLTTVGNFPTGGALSPDGRFLWVVDSGHGADDVQVVEVASGRVVQTLPLPGAYGAAAFAPDGRHAYVSGEPKGSSTPAGPTLGDDGDVVHVFAVDPVTGRATESAPIALPSLTGGSAQRNSLPPVTKVWPAGLDVSPDGRTLAVALNQADRVALVDLATGAVRTAGVGAYPFAARFDADGRTVFVSDEDDGTVSVVDVASASRIATIDVGGRHAHPEGMALDARNQRMLVAVANRDRVVAIDTTRRSVAWSVHVGRPEAPGAQPVAVAVAPDGHTAYAADEGEDALAVLDADHGTLLGKVPTAAFPAAVAVTPDGRRLAWIAAKGFGAGPNPGYQFNVSKPTTSAPPGAQDYVLDKLAGIAGVLDVPTGRALRDLTARATRQAVPANRPAAAPSGTPLRAGGPIKHVFYIVRENRTYDQIFGSEPRGDGDPHLQLFDDNGVAGPTGGVTPNAHALARRFPLLDHVYADSEVSVDGHLITAGSIAIDYAQRGTAANYSDRGRAFDFGVFGVTFGPREFVFDQAVRQGVSFQDYGEIGAGNTPAGNDGRPTYAAVQARSDFTYPTNAQIGCTGTPSPATCTRDSGATGPAATPAYAAVSRYDRFASAFRAQAAAGQVPAFNYLVLPNDHTNGTTAGAPTPKAFIADNDLGLGQIVDTISHSGIWASSAIVVVEDDSQDGADHVDAHRMPAFVISPWARNGVVHTRYDQYSALRTAELLAGLEPLSINDALATPMYDAFRNDGKPDLRPYDAIVPEQPLTERNTSGSPGAALSAKLPLDRLDAVPQALLDRILWHSVRGRKAVAPAPGPGASPQEHARATGALRVLRRGGDVRAWLTAGGAGADGDG